MGFLTNISISNDSWHEVAKDPQKLVDAIGVAMNYGTNSPLQEALDAREGRENSRNYHSRVAMGVPYGVQVHRAKHFDEPQVIVNTWGTLPVPAEEIPYAISHGWLDLNEYNRTHAERVAETLEYTAEQIRQALKKADK